MAAKIASQSSPPPTAANKTFIPKILKTREGESFFEVRCGNITGKLFIEKFKKTYKGANTAGKLICILSDTEEGKWYSLLQFQEAGGRSSNKNWKRSISHEGQLLHRYWDWLSSSDEKLAASQQQLLVDSKLLDHPTLVAHPDSRSDAHGGCHGDHDSSRFEQLEDALMTKIKKAVRDIVTEYMQKEIDNLKEALQSTKELVIHLSQRLSKVEKSAETDKESHAIKSNSPTLFEKVTSLEDIVTNQQKAMEFSQRSYRRNNFIISGLPEGPKESGKEVVHEFLEEKLGIRDISISNAMRLGRIRDDEKSRLVLVTTSSFSEKMSVMKVKNRLKGTHIFINEDLTPLQRSQRRRLWEACQKARSDGKKAYVLGDRLVINGKQHESVKENLSATTTSAVQPQDYVPNHSMNSSQSLHVSVSSDTGTIINND